MNSQHQRHELHRAARQCTHVYTRKERRALRPDTFDGFVRPEQSQHTTPEQTEARLGVRLPGQGLPKQSASTANRGNRLFRRGCGGLVQHGGA